MAIELSLEGYVRSHFKMPHEHFLTYSPLTPWQSEEVIDHRSEMGIYRNVDLSLGLAWMAAHASQVGWYQATNTLHMYRFAQAIRNTPLTLAAAGVIGIALLQAEGMQEFTAGEQLQVLSGVSTPSSSKKHKLMSLSGL